MSHFLCTKKPPEKNTNNSYLWLTGKRWKSLLHRVNSYDILQQFFSLARVKERFFPGYFPKTGSFPVSDSTGNNSLFTSKDAGFRVAGKIILL